PDLDEPDMREELSEVAGNPLLGSSREERIQRNTNATWTAAWLQIAAWLFAMCTVIPFPYILPWMIGMTIIMPFLGIAWMFAFKGVYQVNLSRVRPGLALLFILPALALVICPFINFFSVVDFHILDWNSALPSAAISAVLFACLFSLADRTLRSKPITLLSYSLVMAVYG